LSGPPNWTDPSNTPWNGSNGFDWINDPRWRGALALGYGTGTLPDMNFRALSNTPTGITGTPPTVFYLSWNVRTVPTMQNQTTNQFLHVGF
jgi:hypothetical protein